MRPVGHSVETSACLIVRARMLTLDRHLEEAAGPTEREKTLLNEAQADYDANPTAGAPWREVEARLRGRA